MLDCDIYTITKTMIGVALVSNLVIVPWLELAGAALVITVTRFELAGAAEGGKVEA